TGKGIQPNRRSLGRSKPERNWEKPLIIGRFAGVCLFAPLFQGLDTGLQGFDALERTGQQIGLDVEFFPGDQVHACKCLGHEGLHVALDIGRRGLGQQFGHVLLEIVEQLIGGDHRCLLGWARKTIILPAPAGRSGTASRTYAAPPGRYWIAWPTCPASTRSAPSRSASVRATRRVRRVARADQPQADAARASNARPSASGLPWPSRAAPSRSAFRHPWRENCRCRASTTRARTCAEGSPGGASSHAASTPRLTCRSMRSSSGPEIRAR